MALALADAGRIARDPRFQDRVAGALEGAGATVYVETAFALASQAGAGKVITFSAVPVWVAPGGGIADLTVPASIATGAIITAVTATTVTISASATAVASGDTISFLQHANRASLAVRVSNGNYNVLAFCFGVLSDATIIANGNVNTTPDYNITDAQISTAVSNIWNNLAAA